MQIKSLCRDPVSTGKPQRHQNTVKSIAQFIEKIEFTYSL